MDFPLGHEEIVFISLERQSSDGLWSTSKTFYSQMFVSTKYS